MIKIIQKNNEKGMTLVVVLLMITVFSIISLSVIGFILTNTKQIEKSEKEIQAVDLAEMGIIHFKNLLITNSADVLEYVVKVVNNMTTLKPEEIKDEFIDQIKNCVDEDSDPYRTCKEGNKQLSFIPIIPTPNPKPIISDPLYKYEIMTPTSSFNEEDNSISVKFTSSGMVGSVEEYITIKIVLKLDKLVKIDGDGVISFGNEVGGAEWTGTIPPKPFDVTDICTTGSINTTSCYISVAPGQSYPLPSVDEKIIYVEGPIKSGDGNISIIDSKIYVTGSGDFQNIQGGILRSIIYIGGNTGVHNIQYNDDEGGGIQSSTIFINGNLGFHSIKYGITNESSIYITGDVTFDSAPIISNDSKVCVKKNAYDQKGELIDHPRIFLYETEREAYDANCLVGGKTDIESNISTAINDLEIQYDYETSPE